MQVLQSGRQIVPNHLHGFEGWLIEVGGLPVHHLNHHHPQRPDVHLQGKKGWQGLGWVGQGLGEAWGGTAASSSFASLQPSPDPEPLL